MKMYLVYIRDTVLENGSAASKQTYLLRIFPTPSKGK